MYLALGEYSFVDDYQMCNAVFKKNWKINFTTNENVFIINVNLVE